MHEVHPSKILMVFCKHFFPLMCCCSDKPDRLSTLTSCGSPWTSPLSSADHGYFSYSAVAQRQVQVTWQNDRWQVPKTSLQTGRSFICRDEKAEKADFPVNLNMTSQQAVTTFITVRSRCVRCSSFTITTPLPGMLTPALSMSNTAYLV